MSIRNIFYKNKINLNVLNNTNNSRNFNKIINNKLHNNIISNLIPLTTDKLYTAIIVEP